MNLVFALILLTFPYDSDQPVAYNVSVAKYPTVEACNADKAAKAPHLMELRGRSKLLCVPLIDGE